MDIMTLKNFDDAIKNNTLPATVYLNTCPKTKKLFRDINDSPLNFIEWAYNRRNRLKYLTIDELFESSPFSASNYDRYLDSTNTTRKNSLDDSANEFNSEWYTHIVNEIPYTINDETIKTQVMCELLTCMRNIVCKTCGENKQYSQLNNIFCSTECHEHSTRYAYLDDD